MVRDWGGVEKGWIGEGRSRRGKGHGRVVRDGVRVGRDRLGL